MGWFTRSVHQSPYGRLSVKVLLAAAALTCTAEALAFDAWPVAFKSKNGFHKMTENDLRRVSAQGLPDRLFERMSKYASNGVGIEILGDMATLLNPLAFLLDADTNFRDAVFNPTNPSMIIDANGSALIRLPNTVGDISVRNIHVRGSNGASFGSVLIRGLDFTGTTIRVTRR